MGKTVADFKTVGIFHTLDRDRLRVVLTDTNKPVYKAYGTTNITGPFSAGHYDRCIDQTHPRFHSQMRKRSRKGASQQLRDHDIGGSFVKETSSLSMPSIISMTKPKDPANISYAGIMHPSTAYNVAMLNMSKGISPPISSTLGAELHELNSFGATAIAKSLPDVPNFSLFRFAGELREGLPKIPLKTLIREKKLRNTGGEYLNYQFGIAPLISDLQNFIGALQNPKLRAHVKHALGEEHRVRKVLDKGSTSTSRALTGAEMSVGPASMTNVSGEIQTINSFRIWSSCSFAYHQLTELDRLLDELDGITGGLGVAPTAIDIWNLVPWSWLVDWFVNFNQVATNLSYLGRDGLYLQRGYLMAHYEEKSVTTRRGNLYGSFFSTTGVSYTDRKYRIRASPFGYGFHWKDFDTFQVSILGSLGVSRLKF